MPFHFGRIALIFHGCGRCAGPLGIYKRKRTVIFHLFYHFKRFLEIFFCLSRESDNNIGRQRNIRNCLPKFLYNRQILFFIIMPVHDF